MTRIYTSLEDDLIGVLYPIDTAPLYIVHEDGFDTFFTTKGEALTNTLYNLREKLFKARQVPWLFSRRERKNLETQIDWAIKALDKLNT